MTHSKRILHGNQIRWQANFHTRSTTPLAIGKTFVSQMLTRELFAVANFLVNSTYNSLLIIVQAIVCFSMLAPVKARFDQT